MPDLSDLKKIWEQLVEKTALEMETKEGSFEVSDLQEFARLVKLLKDGCPRFRGTDDPRDDEQGGKRSALSDLLKAASELTEDE